MKKLLPILLALACLGWLAMLAKSCRTSQQLREAKLAYQAYRQISIADTEMKKAQIAALESRQSELMGQIDSTNTVIAARDEEITLQKKKFAEIVGQTEILRTEVQPVIDANPKLREFVAGLDATILAQSWLIVEQDKQVASLKERIVLDDERFNNQVQISEEWRGMYEKEHNLRLLAEDMFKSCVKQQKKTNLWGNVKAVAVGVAVGVVVHAVQK